MTERGAGVVPSPITETYANEATRPFWQAAREGRLVAPKCTTCGTVRVATSHMCFVCRAEAIEWIDLPGTGTVYSFTVVRHALAPELADAVPYVSAVIELDGTQGAGARLLANVIECDPDTVAIGDGVEIVWDRVSDELTLPRFRPAAAKSAN